MSAEVPISPSYGVTALFVGQNGELYGLPLLREDSACQKREAWRTASTAQTIAQGRLSDFSYGAVGGAVAAGETPREALRREMVEELGELLHDGVFAQEIINQFVIRTLVRMPSFFIDQYKNESFRGRFTVWSTLILLDTEIQNSLQSILHPLRESEMHLYRPLLQALYQTVTGIR